MKKGILLLYCLLAFQTIQAQYVITKLWDKTIGGISHETAGDIQDPYAFSYHDFLPGYWGQLRNYILSDGNLLICGSSLSDIGRDKSQNAKGWLDVWIICINPTTGQIIWDKDFGSNGPSPLNWFNQLIKLGDRYLMSIYSFTPVANGDFSVSSPYTGNNKTLIRLLVLDSAFNKIEDRIIAGNGSFQNPHLVVTGNSNYCVALNGDLYVNSDIDDTTSCVKNRIKIKSALACFDSSGTKLWDKIYAGEAPLVGGAPRNYARAITVLPAGGFIFSEVGNGLVGCTATDSSVGGHDINIYRVDTIGNVIWQRYLGGVYNEELYSDKILATADGNFVIAAMTASPQGGEISDPEPGPANSDTTNQSMWIVKFDPAGNILWDKRYGACHYSLVTSAINTLDGGFLIGSTINNYEYNSSIDSLPGCNVTEAGKGDADYWVLKLSSDGNVEWDKRWGGSDRDGLTDLAQLSDGSYLATGLSFSDHGGDKTEDNRDTTMYSSTHHNTADYWVIRFKAEKVVGLGLQDEPINFQIIPNPVKDFCSIEAKNIADAFLTLYDITGRELFSQTFNSKAELDLRKLSSGIYIVQLKTKNGMSAKVKIVKE